MSARAVSLLPQTIFGRLLASLLAAVGITLIVIVLLVMQDRRELALRVGGVVDTSRRITELATTLASMDAPARAHEVARLAAEPILIDEPRRANPGPPPRTMDLAAVTRSFTSELHDLLGDRYQVAVQRAQRGASPVVRLITASGPHERPPGPPPDRVHDAFGAPDGMGPPPFPRGERGPDGPGGGPGRELLDITVTLPDGDDVTFRVPPPWRGPPFPVQLFMQLGVLTMILALVLYLVTRNITRPLTDLAHAADAVGRSARHPPIPEKGVREIREATRAFNTMQDRLLRYVDSRTRVLAAMSHDLRTPLTRLRLRTETIEDATQRARFEADLDEMQTLVGSALGLFKGFDDDEAYELTDVEALVATLRAEFIEMGANVTVEGRAREPLYARPRALKRCLSNLIANAVKFGTRAAIVIEDGDALVIRIRDDGPGIPEASLEQVFEPFFRLESSRNRDTGGSGLGLTIARDIAQAHGATLVLRNLPGGGLEAELSLPRGSEPSAAPA
jgi:signal transduction histidine kinase